MLATHVGGLSEALGTTPQGSWPVVLVPAGDASAMAGWVRSWLEDSSLRDDLRGAARSRRTTLTRWSRTAEKIATVLREVSR